MDTYDFIIAGAGCAGLSLAYHLEQSLFKGSKILLIDPAGDEIPNKTWCYWAEQPLSIHPKSNPVVSWKKLILSQNKLTINQDLGRLSYFHVNSKDFYQSIHSLIRNSKNITLIQEEVIEVKETSSNVDVKVKSGKSYSGSKLFDSRINPNSSFSEDVLKQVFLGWKVKFSGGVFDSSAATLMDVNPVISNLFSFFYILPYSSTEALVEFTAYSKEKIKDATLVNSLKNYLNRLSNDFTYEVTFEEKGVIPMSTQIPVVPASNRIIPIGTRAGWTKSSTGYTFHRIQQNCEKLIQEMTEQKEHSSDSNLLSRFKFYDNILLNIAHKWPEKLGGVFLELFQSSPPADALRFLNEETSFVEELKILSKLRFSIFIKSLLNYEAR
jgi:lycopene beta-cyclase